MKLIEKYAFRKLQREAAVVKRRVVIPNIETIRKVCVLWQPSQEQAYLYLHNYFQRSQVIFRNFCVYNQQPVMATGTNVITPKDLNWMGLPKPALTEVFIQTEYDLLLNVALEQSLVLLYLTAMSRSHFKIGWSPSGLNYFDLNIQINGKKDAEYLARQQIFYLEQLNKKTSV
jgi:hypothetical protein